MTVVLHIHDRSYHLDGVTPADVEARILSALSAGNTFLDLVDDHAGDARVLVTGATPIW